MPDIASLQFNIDSSQAQRAIAVLDTLKATSVSVVQSTNQQSTVQAQLTTGYAQQRDALTRLADQTKAYDGTLSGLLKQLDDLRGKIETSRTGFVAYTTTLNQATQAAVQFNSTVEGLDRYVAKTRELNIVIRDTATGFANIIAAQQNLTVQGNAARTALEQLGVSLKNINPNDPGAVLQQVADRLRGVRENQGTLQAAQAIFGQSFDAQALQRLQRQPYIPFRVAEQTQITTSAAAAVDTTRAGSQRLVDTTTRAEAEREDLRSRFTQDPTLSGRLGLNLLGGTGRAINQTRDEELRRLREIAALPPDQRRQYTGVGTQITDAFQGTPGSQDQGTLGWLGRTYRRATDGSYSANQENIDARYQDERRTQGFFPAFLNAQGRGIANLPGLNAYTPNTPAPLPKTAAELLAERQASGQILSQYGDTGLAQSTEAQRQYTEFTAGDRAQDYNLTSPGTPRPGGQPTLPESAGGRGPSVGPADLPTWAGGRGPAPRPAPTGVLRQRYIDQYGQAGNLRFENRAATLALTQRYAGAPEQRTADDTARDQALLALPAEDRVRARAQLDFLAQTAGPAAATIAPGARPSLNDLVTSNRVTPEQQRIGNQSFQAGVTGQLQQGSEETQRQIELQKLLTDALKDGRAAAEDVTRAYGAYIEAKVRLGASDPDASKSAVEAVTLLQRQRTTQATAQTEQIKQQNDLSREKLEQAKQIQQLDPITKIIMSGQLDIEQQIRTEQRNGTLPNAQGQTRDAQGNVTQLPNAEAQRVIEERRRALQEQQSLAGGATAQGASENVRQNLDDQRELLAIMERQGVTIDQANKLLAIQKQYRDAISAATREGNAVEVERLRGEQAKTESDQGAADRAGQRLQAKTTGQTATRGAELTGVASGGAAGEQALRGELAPVLQPYMQKGGILEGVSLEDAVKRAVEGTLPDQAAQEAAGGVILQHDARLRGEQTVGTTTLNAQIASERQRNAMFARQGSAAAARVPIVRQTTENRAGQQDYEADQQRQRAIVAQEGEGDVQSFTTRTATTEARARAQAARLPVSQAAGAGAALGIQQTVAAGTRQFDPTEATAGQRTYEALGEAIAKYTEETDKANLATRTQIQDQAAANEAVKSGEAAYRDAAIDAQTAAQIRIAEGLKSIATTKEETAALDGWIARLREGSTAQKQLAQDQAAGRLSGQSRTQDQSTAVLNAQTDRGIFANDRDLRQTGEQTRLDQQLKADNLEGTPQAREAQTSLDSAQAARANADQMNNLREAARGAGSAVESAFDAIVIHGQRGRSAALSLVEALGDLILKAAVFKPLENLISGSISGTPSAGGGAGGLLGALGTFLGGAGHAGIGASAAADSLYGATAALPAGVDVSAEVAMAFAASGGVFPGPHISAYSNKIVSRPTMFRFAAGGQVGQMGEGGSPEAVMPLSRDASGRLGVLGAGGGQNIVIHTPITVNGGSGGGGGGMDPATMKILQRQLDQTVRQSVRGVLTNEKRPGGDLYH